jgi:hypothetical protein
MSRERATPVALMLFLRSAIGVSAILLSAMEWRAPSEDS